MSVHKALVVAVPLALLTLVALQGCKSNEIAVTNNNGPGVTDGGTRASCQANPPVSKTGTSPMALMGLTDGATCYWMDQTEVSNAQYSAFLSDTAAKTQPAECSANTSFVPDPTCDGRDADAGDGGMAAKPDNLPVVCVDYCDAAAYCAWAGKTLCKGGAAATDAKTSRWYAACSEGGPKAYPNASGTSVGTCNAKSGGALAPVGTSSCETNDGVQDLAGNAAEWVDECDGAGKCNVRGGSVQSNAQDGSCKGALSLPRIPPNPSVLAFVGFRCCADAPAGSAITADR